MNSVSKLLVCAVASVAAHVGLVRAVEELPRHRDRLPPPRVAIRVETLPPAEPAKAPAPEPPKPKPPPPKPPPKPPPRPKLVHARPRAHRTPPVQAAVPHHTPPVDQAPATDTTDTPAFGVTMQSTSPAGGPAMPVGNTTRVARARAAKPGPKKPLAAPIAAYQATKMPLPQGRCYGKYTPEAKAAGVEGVVVLDLTVGADGRPRDIHVVSGLPHGLTAAAVAALRACRFSPGEDSGKRVAVRIRGFKIRFVLSDAD